MQDERLTNLFYEIFEDIPRQGPGDAHSTAQALQLCTGLPPRPRVLDLGCGAGLQTLELARLTGGDVTGVDTHPAFLERLRAAARHPGFDGRVHAVAGDMRDLPFPDASFDLVWCEGAVYNMGFSEALRSWRRLLAPGGCLALSDAAWLRPDPPEPCRDLWRAYPGMRDVPTHLAWIREAGYESLGWFILPESSWRDAYCVPLGLRLERFRADHADDPEALGLADRLQHEIEVFTQYLAWFGYAFHALRRP